MDWGLGQAGSRKWGLRNTLLISHEEPWPYYLAVVADLVLRLAWLLRLMEGRFRHMDMVLTLEVVEVGGSGVRVLLLYRCCTAYLWQCPCVNILTLCVCVVPAVEVLFVVVFVVVKGEVKNVKRFMFHQRSALPLVCIYI